MADKYRSLWIICGICKIKNHLVRGSFHLFPCTYADDAV